MAKLIAGGTSIQIVSGGEVHNVPGVVPEPRYTGFLLVGLLAVIAFIQNKRPLLRPKVTHFLICVLGQAFAAWVNDSRNKSITRSRIRVFEHRT